jgi:hypothetical protein
MRDETSRTKAPRPTDHAHCPGCDRRRPGDNTRTQTVLLRIGEHLVWAAHDVVTWAGARRPCRACGIPVCQLPPRHGYQPACPCRAGLIDGVEATTKEQP